MVCLLLPQSTFQKRRRGRQAPERGLVPPYSSSKRDRLRFTRQCPHLLGPGSWVPGPLVGWVSGRDSWGAGGEEEASCTPVPRKVCFFLDSVLIPLTGEGGGRGLTPKWAGELPWESDSSSATDLLQPVPWGGSQWGACTHQPCGASMLFPLGSTQR